MLKYPIGLGTEAGAFTELIPAGTALPHTYSDIFGNSSAGQTAIGLSLSQMNGEELIPVANAAILGLPAKPKGVLQIQVEITIDDQKRLYANADLLDYDNKAVLRAGPFSVE